MATVALSVGTSRTGFSKLIPSLSHPLSSPPNSLHQQSRVQAMILSRITRPLLSAASSSRLPLPSVSYCRRMSLNASIPIPILETVEQVRAWRRECIRSTTRLQRREGRIPKRGLVQQEEEEQEQEESRIGFVPTMGALHEGHLSLVRASLAENDHTIVSIFVNPTQFSPTEDLSTYPRTLDADLNLLSALSFTPASSSSSSSSPLTRTSKSSTAAASSAPRKVSAVFLPSTNVLYPGGTTTNVALQRGTFVEVKGVQDGMEGNSRPGFFRGVATVVLKLFNIIQPTRAYFGQKDIQQALLLRRLASDLHLTHPSPHSLIIAPTARDPTSGLALSSRNVYLSPKEKEWATSLIQGLRQGEKIYLDQRNHHVSGNVVVEDVLAGVRNLISEKTKRAKEEEVEMELIYVNLNDPREMRELTGTIPGGNEETGRRGAVLSAAMRVGKTRLIDNLVLEFELN